MLAYDLWEHLGRTADLPSRLDTPLFHLAVHFEKLGLGLTAILTASDEALLEAPGFGPRSLATFRAVVPGHPTWQFAFMDDLLWQEHAEMVAGVR